MLGNLARFVIPAAALTAGFGTAVYAVLYEQISKGFSSGRTPAQVIGEFESYTGLTSGMDADFPPPRPPSAPRPACRPSSASPRSC
jgi:cation-transporting ATPase E